MKSARGSFSRPACLAVLLATSSAPALAAGDNPDRWYLGGAVVFSNVQFDDEAIDDDAVGGKLTLGYQANEWFGVEGSWLNSGDFEDDQTPADNGGDASLDLSGFIVDAVAYAPFGTEDVRFFGKAGFYRFRQSLDVTDDVGVVSQSSARNIDGLTLGAGLRVRIAERVDIRAEGEWFDLDGADLWSLSLGADYRFGGSR
jgi:opacity protein-like surface antigen